jgi:hypothetical protein
VGIALIFLAKSPEKICNQFCAGKKFCATTQFDASKVHSSGFNAPYTLSQGLDRTLKYEFVHEKKDDITFMSE